MKLIDVDELKPPFDCAAGMAEALIATGKVKRYETPLPNQPVHVTKFWVKAGHEVEDFQFPPEIAWSCGKCGVGHISGPNAHKQKLYHIPPFAFAQEIPKDISTEFIAARRTWEKRFGKKFVDPNLTGRQDAVELTERTIDEILASVGIKRRPKE